MQIRKAEPAVKWDGWKIVLSESVAESLKAVTVDDFAGFHDDRPPKTLTMCDWMLWSVNRF